jgi:hypothetical protein
VSRTHWSVSGPSIHPVARTPAPLLKGMKGCPVTGSVETVADHADRLIAVEVVEVGAFAVGSSLHTSLGQKGEKTTRRGNRVREKGRKMYEIRRIIRHPTPAKHPPTLDAAEAAHQLLHLLLERLRLDVERLLQERIPIDLPTPLKAANEEGIDMGLQGVFGGVRFGRVVVALHDLFVVSDDGVGANGEAAMDGGGEVDVDFFRPCATCSDLLDGLGRGEKEDQLNSTSSDWRKSGP